ncbi:penicillin-binding protein 2, partial [Flavobacteriaceae bacterium]|nr:penicillin-binding protein 2 [Flavobacteriaceae bacterium]
MIKRFVLLSFTLGSALLFIFKLISLQIINKDFSERSLSNAIEERPVYPTRGLIFDRNGILLVSNQPVYDLMIVPENLVEFDTLELISFLDISKEELTKQIQQARRFSTKIPSIISKQISKEKQAIFQEKIWKYPGFYFQKKTIRDYPVPIASNVIGYTSEINPAELKNKSDYTLGEMIGRQGIEKTYEKVLKGKKGVQFF